eukprot:scaffold334344_cov21-Prasinocladus_malaysianus.AAC.1
MKAARQAMISAERDCGSRQKRGSQLMQEVGIRLGIISTPAEYLALAGNVCLPSRHVINHCVGEALSPKS